jgi:hypothetical protein
MHLLPKTTIKKLDLKMRKFLWWWGGGVIRGNIIW